MIRESGRPVRRPRRAVSSCYWNCVGGLICLEVNTNMRIVFVTANTSSNVETLPSDNENVNANRWLKDRDLRAEECGGAGDCAYHVLSRAIEYNDESVDLSDSLIRDGVANELVLNRSDYDGFIVNVGETKTELDTFHETYDEFIGKVREVSKSGINHCFNTE